MKPAVASTILAALTALQGGARAGEELIELRDAPGRRQLMAGCMTCHSADYILMNATVMDRSRWEVSVRKMIDKLGAPLSEADAVAIIDYLASNYSNRR